jgi:hypothetical protein
LDIVMIACCLLHHALKLASHLIGLFRLRV